MLKELWRKLGSDFLQADSTYNECRESTSGLYGSADFRILPHITHTGEFHLERLTSLLNSRYGRNTTAVEASSDDAIRDLIVFAARIQDQDIQRELLLLYLNCSPVIQEYLRSHEILGSSHFLSR
ncbi:hypothetical protein [Marinobacter sp.]|uniref:hypothetical protein n=1 Tax=Marinobacter sp. TaxID=50741 RepID=UPI001B64888A|nr:hypothetical protein [Marinobacter sp.]MBQ0832455.1 hypothetical protein [Marinobacter sp.]